MNKAHLEANDPRIDMEMANCRSSRLQSVLVLKERGSSEEAQRTERRGSKGRKGEGTGLREKECQAMRNRSRAGKAPVLFEELGVMPPGKSGGESEGAERWVEVSCSLQSFSKPGTQQRVLNRSLAPSLLLLLAGSGLVLWEEQLERMDWSWALLSRGCCRGSLDK